MNDTTENDDNSESLWSPEPKKSNSKEILLHAARTGDLETIINLYESVKNDSSQLDLNCKGNQKGNLGWTPLHLSAYFGHLPVLDFLLKHNADVNVLNNDGDTPLHKAAYTGREEAVVLLLTHDASILLKNGVGDTAIDVAKTTRITQMLQAAVDSDIRRQESKFLSSVRDGDILTIKNLINEKGFRNINCIDSSGNTALHCAAYRNRKEVAIFLLQVGADSTIRNNFGQIAKDLAGSPQMCQILDVKPVRHLQKSVARFEGAILRRNRLFGWKANWAVIERGVISFFRNRADATTGNRRKDYKYLDGAKVQKSLQENGTFSVSFSDNTTQTYSVPSLYTKDIDREKWTSALQEHADYSTHYIQQGLAVSDDEDDMSQVLPLSSMQDALISAQAHQRLLEAQIGTVALNLETFTKVEPDLPLLNGTHHWLNTTIQLRELVDYSKKVASSLSHCMTLFAQQEEVRKLQLRQEQEKSRVLEDALHALAKEHHVLECSLSAAYRSPCQSPMLKLDDTEGDEFFDAFGDDEDTLTPHLDISDEEDEARTLYDTEPVQCELYYSFPDPSECDVSSQYQLSPFGRAKLPVPMFSKDEFSMWSILKQCIGKELSKITMPVIFNEPLSLLQRIAEYMEYCDLLTRANQSSDPVERMQLVSAFATSASASNWERIGKPFNPLLGETYELVREESGFRLVCEQVSHHPPISAFHAQSKNFIFYGSVYPKLKFWGKSIEVIPEGVVTVELPSHKEVYTWNNVTCCIHNIIVGKLWLEQYGVMEVVCHQSHLKAVLNFKPAGWFGRDLHRIEGYIYDKQKKKLRFLYGKWTDYLKSAEVSAAEQYFKSHSYLKSRNQSSQAKSESATPTGSPAHSSRKVVSKLNNLTRQLTGGGSPAPPPPPPSASAGSANDLPSLSGGAAELENSEVPKSDSAYSLDIPNSELVWRAIPRPEYSPEYYHFTLFAMSLNEVKPDMESHLPPTDSRLRPDIRKLEEGDMSGAAFEKNRLEEKQRDVRKQRKKSKEIWEPLWFHIGKHACVKDDVWLFRSTYWKRDYGTCPDIF